MSSPFNKRLHLRGQAVPESGARRPVSRVLSTPGLVRHGARTTIPLGRASLRASRDQPGRRGGNAPEDPRFRKAPVAPIRSCSRWGLPCRFRCRSRGAPLPHRFTLAVRASGRPSADQAVCFLWHCPWGRPRRPLAGTVFPWSPDFPPRRRPSAKRGPTQRPSSRLARRCRPPGLRGQASPTKAAIALTRARVPASASPLTASCRQCR